MFKLKDKSVKEDARKFGMTLIGAAVLAVSFKSPETYNFISGGITFSIGVLVWLYGSMIITEVAQKDDT